MIDKDKEKNAALEEDLGGCEEKEKVDQNWLGQPPRLNKQELDLAKLWNLVAERKGSARVTMLKEWPKIGREFDIPTYMTNFSTIIKGLYIRHLLPYEQFLHPTLAMEHEDLSYPRKRKHKADKNQPKKPKHEELVVPDNENKSMDLNNFQQTELSLEDILAKNYKDFFPKSLCSSSSHLLQPQQANIPLLQTNEQLHSLENTMHLLRSLFPHNSPVPPLCPPEFSQNLMNFEKNSKNSKNNNNSNIDVDNVQNVRNQFLLDVLDREKKQELFSFQQRAQKFEQTESLENSLKNFLEKEKSIVQGCRSLNEDVQKFKQEVFTAYDNVMMVKSKLLNLLDRAEGA